MISPLAYIEDGAQIGANVKIHPFAYIQKQVVIGDNCVIHPHVSLLNGTRLGTNNEVYSNTIIGAKPQSFQFVEGTPTHVTIGNNNCIRENVVVAGGYLTERGTVIGNNNHFMDRAHLCHDVRVHDRAVIGIGSVLSGNSAIYTNAIISNNAIVLEEVRIGRFSLLQSGTRVSKDVPPYIIVRGNPATYGGINTRVLAYEGINERTLRHIANAYRLVYKSDFSLEDTLLQIKEQVPAGEEVQKIIDFMENTTLGIVRQVNEYD